MFKVITLAVMATLATANLSMNELHDMSMKSIADSRMFKERVLARRYTKGATANSFAGTNDFPELDMLEKFLTGFLSGSSFVGNAQCTAALQGMIFYGFEVVRNREVYNPRKTMKAVISTQKFTEQQSLFSAYCDASHLYRIANSLVSFDDYKQYGQFGSRLMGIAISSGPRLLKCIKDGVAQVNGADFYNVGECTGNIVSQILDAQF